MVDLRLLTPVEGVHGGEEAALAIGFAMADDGSCGVPDDAWPVSVTYSATLGWHSEDGYVPELTSPSEPFWDCASLLAQSAGEIWSTGGPGLLHVAVELRPSSYTASANATTDLTIGPAFEATIEAGGGSVEVHEWFYYRFQPVRTTDDGRCGIGRDQFPVEFTTIAHARFNVTQPSYEQTRTAWSCDDLSPSQHPLTLPWGGDYLIESQVAPFATASASLTVVGPAAPPVQTIYTLTPEETNVGSIPVGETVRIDFHLQDLDAAERQIKDHALDPTCGIPADHQPATSGMIARTSSGTTEAGYYTTPITDWIQVTSGERWPDACSWTFEFRPSRAGSFVLQAAIFSPSGYPLSVGESVHVDAYHEPPLPLIATLVDPAETNHIYEPIKFALRADAEGLDENCGQQPEGLPVPAASIRYAATSGDTSVRRADAYAGSSLTFEPATCTWFADLHVEQTGEYEATNFTLLDAGRIVAAGEASIVFDVLAREPLTMEFEVLASHSELYGGERADLSLSFPIDAEGECGVPEDAWPVRVEYVASGTEQDEYGGTSVSATTTSPATSFPDCETLLRDGGGSVRSRGVEDWWDPSRGVGGLDVQALISPGYYPGGTQVSARTLLELKRGFEATLSSDTAEVGENVTFGLQPVRTAADGRCGLSSDGFPATVRTEVRPNFYAGAASFSATREVVSCDDLTFTTSFSLAWGGSYTLLHTIESGLTDWGSTSEGGFSESATANIVVSGDPAPPVMYIAHVDGTQSTHVPESDVGDTLTFHFYLYDLDTGQERVWDPADPTCGIPEDYTPATLAIDTWSSAYATEGFWNNEQERLDATTIRVTGGAQSEDACRWSLDVLVREPGYYMLKPELVAPGPYILAEWMGYIEIHASGDPLPPDDPARPTIDLEVLVANEEIVGGQSVDLSLRFDIDADGECGIPAEAWPVRLSYWSTDAGDATTERQFSSCASLLNDSAGSIRIKSGPAESEVYAILRVANSDREILAMAPITILPLFEATLSTASPVTGEAVVNGLTALRGGGAGGCGVEAGSFPIDVSTVWYAQFPGGGEARELGRAIESCEDLASYSPTFTSNEPGEYLVANTIFVDDYVETLHRRVTVEGEPIVGDYGGFDWTRFQEYPPAGGQLLRRDEWSLVDGGERVLVELTISPDPDGSCSTDEARLPMSLELSETSWYNYARSGSPDPHANLSVLESSLTTCGESVFLEGITSAEGVHQWQMLLVDAAGGVAFGPYVFLVTQGFDYFAPSMRLPETIVANATSAQGAIVTWEATATNTDTMPVDVTCEPASGSLFPIGSTRVECEAYDGDHRANATIDVHVERGDTPANTTDTTPPETWLGRAIDGDGDVVGNGNGTLSHNLTLAFYGTDDVDAAVTAFECSLDGAAYVACVSNQTYYVEANGTHALLVRATDSSNNTDASPAQFTWLVQTTAEAIEESIAYVESLFISDGAKGSLLKLLEDAQSRIESGTPKDITKACASLGKFLDLVEKDRKKGILTNAEADTLRDDATAAREDLGCA